MSEMIDLATRLAEPYDDDEPNPYLPVVQLYDPNRPPRGYYRGYKPPSGHYYALRTIWRWTCALMTYRESLNASDYKVFYEFLELCARGKPNKEYRGPTDSLTISYKELATLLHAPESSVRDAVKRLARDEWFVITDPGKRTVRRSADGSWQGSGQAATFKLKPWPHPIIGRTPKPTTRRRVPGEVVGREACTTSRDLGVGLSDVDERQLDGRAQPVHEPDLVASVRGLRPRTKCSTDHTHTTIETMVSTRGLYHGEPSENRAGEPSETDLLPVTEWLTRLLADWGPIARSDVLAMGVKAGYSVATIRRTAARLGVVSTPATTTGGGKGKPPRTLRMWHLP